MALRGCGSREEGGIYAECLLGSGPGSMPLEWFLADPERLMLIPGKLKVSPLGVHPIYVNGPPGEKVLHLLDWVGSEHYPNVADFLEEVRRMGMSRRLPDSTAFPYQDLTRASRHLLIHARAIPQDREAYHAERVAGWAHCLDELEKEGAYLRHTVSKILSHREWARAEAAAGGFRALADSLLAAGDARTFDCPTFCGEHRPCPRNEACAGLWWEDLDPDGQEGRWVDRKQPSFTYRAACRPLAVQEKGPKWAPGFIARFPISRLAVIRGAGHDEDGGPLEKARRAGVPTVELDE